MLKLEREFFQQNAVIVARDLLGKALNFYEFSGIITETEAYRGIDDPASHAFKGPTCRSQIMFEEPGFTYVYMIYGMYFCLNIVTEHSGNASAVLIRGLKLADRHLDGPGKICKHLNIDKKHNKIDLVADKNFNVVDHGIKILPTDITITGRIGIKKAIDKPWRFLLKV